MDRSWLNNSDVVTEKGGKVSYQASSVSAKRVKNSACDNGFKVGHFGWGGWISYPLTSKQMIKLVAVGELDCAELQF